MTVPPLPEGYDPEIDTLVESVRHDLACRSALGLKKYKTSMDRRDLSLREWLQNAYEEMLDGALYLKRAIRELPHNS